jgi:hypothetical protein
MKCLKHPATIIAAAALFIAMGGSAAAYASGLISGSQIKNHSIPAKKLTKSAIRSLHGMRGPTGPMGPPGIQGPAGPSSATSTLTSGAVNIGGGDTIVASLAVPAGSYVVMANTSIYNTSANEKSDCGLNDSKAGFLGADGLVSTDATNDSQEALSLVATLTSTGSTVDIDCTSSDVHTNAYDTRLVALKVGSVTGTLRHGNPNSPSFHPAK